MLDRLGYIVLSFAVCLMCVIPSSAWSYQSFVGVENLPTAEDYSPDSDISLFSVASEEGIAAQADTSGVTSISGTEILPYWSVDSSTQAFGLSVNETLSFDSVAGITIPSQTIDVMYPDSFSDGIPVGTTVVLSRYVPISIQKQVDDPPNHTTFNSINYFLFGSSGFSGPGSAAVPYVEINFDLSSFGTFSSFGMNGSLVPCVYMDTPFVPFYGGHIDLYVNGAFVRSFYADSSGYVDFANFVYDGSVSISSLQFRVYFQSFNYSIDVDISSFFVWQLAPASFVFTVLSSGLGKPAAADALDSNINNAQDLEGQVWEDFSSKFNGLSVSITDGIASAASLLGGLFNDLWTTMGDVKLIYFAPLYFGLLFWILGRVRR